MVITIQKISVREVHIQTLEVVARVDPQIWFTRFRTTTGRVVPKVRMTWRECLSAANIDTVSDILDAIVIYGIIV